MLTRRSFLSLLGVAAAVVPFVRARRPSLAELNQRDLDDVRRRYNARALSGATWQWTGGGHPDNWYDARNWQMNSGSIGLEFGENLDGALISPRGWYPKDGDSVIIPDGFRVTMPPDLVLNSLTQLGSGVLVMPGLASISMVAATVQRNPMDLDPRRHLA